MIQSIPDVLFLLLYGYVAVSTLYLLVMAAAGRWGRGHRYDYSPVKKSIAVIIPAYSEDAIIVDTVRQACSHHYPGGFFRVIVIADSLQQETLEQLSVLPVRVQAVHFDVSTKAKSIHAALQLPEEGRFDIAFMLDADNIMAPGCLEKVNNAFQGGCKAVQCHRTAKNTDTPVALLDAISEAINNNLFRRGPSVIGLSAAPSGSGMAFEFGMLQDIFRLEHIQNSAGEDREIDIELLKRKLRMEFVNDAYVFDEKVADAGSFEKQRTRWLEAQMNHVLRFFQPDMKKVPRTVWYYSRFFQTLLLPRLLYLLIAALVTGLLMLQWVTGIKLLYPPSAWWLVWMAAYGLTLLISVPRRFFTLQTLKAVLTIPVLVLSMLKALMGLKRNRKEFLHTGKRTQSYTTDRGAKPS